MQPSPRLRAAQACISALLLQLLLASGLCWAAAAADLPPQFAPMVAETAAALAGGAVAAVSEQLVKPACDKLAYRHVRLSNGLRVLLISDPETDKAAASLNVRAPRVLPAAAAGLAAQL